MPAYFPENNEPQADDTVLRSLHKLCYLADAWAGGNGTNAPEAGDLEHALLFKLVKSLLAKSNA